MTDRCAMCDHPIPDHSRSIRYQVPDRLAGRDLSGAWLSGPDPMQSFMMRTESGESFVRALLPVHLTGGFAATCGVWVEVEPSAMDRAFEIWFAPEYASLEMDGRLANEIGSWHVSGRPVHLAVRDQEQLPNCVSSPDPELATVIRDEWDHEFVLSTLPG